MTILTAYTESQLRTRIEHALTQLKSDPSLYLTVLGCLFLACDEVNLSEEAALEQLFYAQAELEDLDGDEVLSALLMVKS